MGRVLFATIALLSGCVAAESAVGPRVYQPKMVALDEPVCLEEYPTGSNIKRMACHEPLSAERRERAMWRGVWRDLFRIPAHATYTPGLRIYR
jgi:hypothetical protein